MKYLSDSHEYYGVVSRSGLHAANVFAPTAAGDPVATSSYDKDTHSVTWNIAGVPAGGSGKVTVTVKVKKAAATVGSIKNAAKVIVGDEKVKLKPITNLVEKEPEETTEETTVTTTEDTSTTDTTAQQAAQTGDTTPIGTYLALMLAAICMAFGIRRFRRNA